MKVVHHLVSTAMEYAEAVRDERNQPLWAQVCPRCKDYLGLTPPPMVFLYEKPKQVPLAGIAFHNIGMFRADFLEWLRLVMDGEGAATGRVCDPDGKVYEDFVTYLPRHRVTIRGDERSKMRICESCHRRHYHPRATAKGSGHRKGVMS